MSVTIAGYYGGNTTPGYNLQHDIEITEVGYTEPVTLAEARAFCKLEEIETEDDLLTEMITAARQGFEKAAQISIIEKSVVLWFSNPEGMYPLPAGPVQTFDALYDYQDEEIVAADYELIGSMYPKLKSPVQCFMKAEYTVGMTAVPKDIKQAILEQIYFLYEERGNEGDKPLCDKAWMVAQRWNRYGFVA